MPANSHQPHLWKADIQKSVDLYNQWFLAFAPKAYRDTRKETTEQVESALLCTRDLRDVTPDIIKGNPKTLQMLRMATAPPIARDRLIGLSGVTPSLVYTIEDEGVVPPRMEPTRLQADLLSICGMITRLADPDIFTWLESRKEPTPEERYRAATIVADRLCGAIANPIIRNAQERRQLANIREWLEGRGYNYVPSNKCAQAKSMPPGTFCFRPNVPVRIGKKEINIPVDVAIKARSARASDLPLFVEAKSAGDFTNVNKRRKEEATKIGQLRTTYGAGVRYILFLCGYFDSGYLGYEAAEGLDWVWEHRIDDFKKFRL